MTRPNKQIHETQKIESAMIISNLLYNSLSKNTLAAVNLNQEVKHKQQNKNLKLWL